VGRWFLALGACLLGWTAPEAPGQPRLAIQALTNRETSLTLSVSNGPRHRVQASSNLTAWENVVTLPPAASSLSHTDSATPFLPRRYYRAEEISGTNFLTGDHLPTSDGDLVIRPLYHASLALSWNGRVIYVDPDDDPAFETRYASLPKADLILVTHDHGDHYSTNKLATLRSTNGTLVVPHKVFNRADFTAFRPHAIPLAYGGTTTAQGIAIEAVAGYNSYHTFTNNNAYVVTLGGRRLLITGDSGNTPELRALANIDVAFLCINIPFTMTIFDATNLVRAIQPRIVYPYHYRDSGGSQTNAAAFKQILGLQPGIEVRLRNWY
jgi:L-ascorbate metabolism protein UlaG (beta-lactamase superfamily)